MLSGFPTGSQSGGGGRAVRRVTGASNSITLTAADWSGVVQVVVFLEGSAPIVSVVLPAVAGMPERATVTVCGVSLSTTEIVCSATGGGDVCGSPSFSVLWGAGSSWSMTHNGTEWIAGFAF